MPHSRTQSPSYTLSTDHDVVEALFCGRGAREWVDQPRSEFSF